MLMKLKRWRKKSTKAYCFDSRTYENIDFDASEDYETKLEDSTVIDTEKVKNKSGKIPTEISKCQEDDEVMYDETAIYTGNTVMNNTETMENETTEILVENEDTVEDMDFDELTIHSDASAYDILEEEHETISLSNIVLVKVKKETWQGNVITIPSSDRKGR